MQIPIRSYVGGDEAEILDLWARVLTRDPIDPATFYQKFLLDPNFDPASTLVAIDHDRVVGFVQAMVRRTPLGGDYEPEMGWITALLVDPEYQRQNIGTRLLEQVETWLQQQGRQRVEFSSYAPNYVVPGVDEAAYPGATAFFTHAGYRVLYTAVSMDRNLVDYVMPESVRSLVDRLRQEGVDFEPIQPRFYLPLLDFCDREFYGDWTRALREALIREVPPSQLMICREGSTILGFTLFGAYDRSFERFGPFGVAADQRGRGLGKALLHLTLTEQKRQYCHASWFLWAALNSPAGHLYTNTGFSVSRRFNILQKALR